MNFKFVFTNLFVIIMLLSCDNSVTDSNNEAQNSTELSIGNNINNSIQIQLSSSEDIAGFQFSLTGVTITGASGGLADQYGFSVSSGESIIIGFSFSGDVIPSGSNGILTNISVSEIFSSICIDEVIFSNSNGQAIEVTVSENCLDY